MKRSIDCSTYGAGSNSRLARGYGGASGRFDRLHETAFAIAFALKVVGAGGIGRILLRKTQK